MPGIAGLITKMPRERAEQQLLRMIGSLCHEPFYETGTWVDESLGVYVGWTAAKESFSSGMPLRDERGDVVLVFSGEEYSESRCTSGAAAASYLLRVYGEDASFPAGLNGR